MKKLIHSLMLTLTFFTICSFAQDHSLVIKHDGTVWAWGNNSSGQLGNGKTYNSDRPIPIINPPGQITKAECGGLHSIVLTSDGEVYTWGENWDGQLGDGDETYTIKKTWVKVNGLANTKIIDVKAGRAHSLALAEDGTIYSWGSNSSGQLGRGQVGAKSNIPRPVSISGDLSGKIIIAIAAGGQHSMALASDGTIYTWGMNYYGQLGNGKNSDSYVPVAVQTSGVLLGKFIKSIAAGGGHSIALASDGTAYSWGNNGYGELGSGNNTNSNIPIIVGLTGEFYGKIILSIEAGGNHSMALASDGTIYTWGRNQFGQLGNGNNTSSYVPVVVNTTGVLAGETIIYMVAGSEHCLAVLGNGRVFTWGRNQLGQLGNITNIDSNTPVDVLSFGIPSEKKLYL